MTSPATNRQFLLELARATLESLQSAPLESVTDVNPDAVKNSLKAALDWARLEDSAASLEAVAPSTGAEPYLPSNQTLSLLQSAYDEYIDSRGLTELPFDPSDPGWQTIAQDKLKAASRGKHPFISHTSPGSFLFELPSDATVALFSDWGTGEATAQRVMQQIAAARPTHAIHLGDVYYAWASTWGLRLDALAMAVFHRTFPTAKYYLRSDLNDPATDSHSFEKLTSLGRC
jgi:hypothetical protein